MNFTRKLSGTLLASALLAACGGSGGVDGSGTDGNGIPDIANGGIGGSGSGTVTGFGSIIVNDIREFEFSDDTTVYIDGEIASDDDIKLGMVVTVNVDDDANDDFTRGTLLSVYADHLLKGPVTSINPLRVLNQEISVVSSTVLDSLPGNSISGLQIGDTVEIAGHVNGTLIRASRIEYKPGGVLEWQLRGNITGATSLGILSIGSQIINYSMASFENCSSDISEARYVEINAAAVEGFTSGDSLTASKIECISSELFVPDDSSISTERASLEGFVDEVISTSVFTINGEPISTTSATVYENGNANDLVAGVKVEAEGLLDIESGELQAAKISFRESRFRIEAPVQPDDVSLGESVTILGLTINALSTTEDEDAILQGLSDAIQVEIRGFTDANGTAYAEEIRERGTADAGDTVFRGPVTAKEASTSTFTLLGSTVNTSGAQLKSANDTPMTEAAFFTALRVGQEVKVQDASFNTVTHTFTGGEIELED